MTLETANMLRCWAELYGLTMEAATELLESGRGDAPMSEVVRAAYVEEFDDLPASDVLRSMGY